MKSFRYEVSNRPWHGEGRLFLGACLLFGVLIVFGLVASPLANRALAVQTDDGSAKIQVGTSGQNGSMFEHPTSGVNFGYVVVGGLATEQATVTNNSHATITLSTSQVSGPPFSVSGLNLPVTLGSGQSLAFTAQFAPTSTGTFSGNVTFEGTNSQKFTTPLLGKGIASTLILSLSPTSLSFGNVSIGDDAQLPVLIRNTGTGSVTISGASLTGTGYAFSNLNLPETLNAGQSTSFTVTFAPTGSGASEGTVSLTSNATTSPNIESLSGTGVASGNYVTLTWTDSTSPGVLEYDIYRGTKSGGPYSEIATVSGTSTSYTDNTVSAGQTYYYVATTITGTGESGYSNQAMANVP